MFRFIKHEKVADYKVDESITQSITEYLNHTPDYVFFDTETTGLNIRHDVPFLLQYGWVIDGTLRTYTKELEHINKRRLQEVIFLFKSFEKNSTVVGQNVKFDLHMMRNIGIEYRGKLTDTQIYIRLAHDALTPANGGPPLGLKEYAKQYIDKDAKMHEHILRLERTGIAKDLNMRLIGLTRGLPDAPEGFKTWNKGALESFFKDVLKTKDDLPAQVKHFYDMWYDTIPDKIKRNMKSPMVETNDVPYDMLNRKAVIEYGHYDIVYTAAILQKTAPVLAARNQQHALEIEQEVILPLFDMESVGFAIDKEYVYASLERMRTYLAQRRHKLKVYHQADLTVGQHAKIKEHLYSRYGIVVASTGTEALGELVPKLKAKGNKYAVEFIELIKELRTLEKWYSTYLMRFINEIKYHDRIYTQINQVGTVSGRVTSDFQQFPKYGIKTVDGDELFNPRKMIVKSDESIGLVYIDYSQIELRLQAIYTIMLGHPDLNLCRAYMPYKCWALNKRGERVEFDYNNPNHINNAYTQDWRHIEDDEHWVKTDVHSATTKLAFPDLDPGTDQFAKLRGKVGKRVNFAKNYGAQYSKIATMFPEMNFDEETLHRIDDAYYAAFPGVKEYHQYCYQLAREQVYASNLFGIRYYGLTGHKLINTLVQGSGAYFLKIKMRQVQEHLRYNGYKTKFQMNIHDEMSFELVEGEEHVIFEIQDIMQQLPDTVVPIVADIEVSTSSWADKKEASDMEDVKRILHGDI